MNEPAGIVSTVCALVKLELKKKTEKENIETHLIDFNTLENLHMLIIMMLDPFAYLFYSLIQVSK